MKQVVQQLRDGKTVIEEVPPPAVRASGAVVRNAFSLVSAGTEKHILDIAGGNLLDKARKRPDLVRQVLDKVRTEGLRATYEKVMNKLDMPMALGYSSAGVVLGAGDGSSLRPGDRVACAGMGYASHAEEVFVPHNLCVKVPDAVSLRAAAFTTLGAIALQGVRVAQVQVGELALVIGLGLVGQLAAQVLRAAGCRVVGYDIDPWKAGLAREHGLEAVSRPEDIPSAPVLGGRPWRGFDAVLIAAGTDRNEPIEMAGEWARHKGVVSVVGVVRMDVPRKVYYEKELEVRLSRSYGPGRYDPQYEARGVDYPYAYVRWTEQRNMEAFLDLLAEGRVRVDRLITHTFPVAEALSAYDLITSKTPTPYLGILLDYRLDEGAAATAARPMVLHTAAAARGPAGLTGSQPLGIGLIGAGNFARSVLLPKLRQLPGVRLAHVASATGLSAKSTAQKFGFERCSTDHEALLADEAVGAVVIATRHHLHAPLAAAALRRGRAVFVEKPLGLDEAQLQEVLRAWQAAALPYLMVGFNRRFAPMTDEVRRFFAGHSQPLAMTYRVNAGALPPESWLQSPEEGGGRIIGEACHFIDWMACLAGAPPAQVFARALGTGGAPADNVIVTVTFADGSLGSLQYLANGDRWLPKERAEVFCDGAVAVLEDFRRLMLARDGKVRIVRRFSQDKGHAQELKAFVDSLRRGAPAPVPLEDLVATTRATFKVIESLQTGQPVDVPSSF